MLRIIIFSLIGIVGFMFTAHVKVRFKPFKIKFDRPVYALQVYGWIIAILLVYLAGESFAKSERTELYRQTILLTIHLERARDSLRNCQMDNILQEDEFHNNTIEDYTFKN